MYHVTDISEDDSPDHPKWTEIRLSTADDKTYNGELLHLPVASFQQLCITVIFQPSHLTQDVMKKIKYYWQVKIPFEYDKYNMFLMNDHPTQIHLLCLTKDGMDGSTGVENILNILATKIIKERHLKDKDVLEYFPNGQPNDYIDSDTKWFVNLFFIKPIKIPNGSEWDEVKRSRFKHGA